MIGLGAVGLGPIGIGGAFITPTTMPKGMQWSEADDRLHFEADAGRLHFEAGADRLHFEFPKRRAS